LGNLVLECLWQQWYLLELVGHELVLCLEHCLQALEAERYLLEPVHCRGSICLQEPQQMALEELEFLLCLLGAFPLADQLPPELFKLLRPGELCQLLPQVGILLLEGTDFLRVRRKRFLASTEHCLEFLDCRLLLDTGAQKRELLSAFLELLLPCMELVITPHQFVLYQLHFLAHPLQFRRAFLQPQAESSQLFLLLLAGLFSFL
jgi:hypothetical protein